MTLFSRSIARSRFKLEWLYLHYHSAYGYQSWQYLDLPWRTLTYKVTRSFGHVDLQDHVTYKKVIFPVPQCLWPPNVAGCWLTPSVSLMSHDPLITWSSVTNENHYIFTTTMPMVTKLAGWWLNMSGSHHGLVRSCDILNTLYLLLQWTPKDQWTPKLTSDKLLWGTFTHKIT